MASTSRTIDLTAPDGGTYHGLLTLPDVTPAPAVLLVHEIFGVNSYLEEVAERLALLGYATLTPDLFWRIDPDNPLDTNDENMGVAFERIGRFDFAAAGGDLAAALTQLAALPEVSGTPAVLGFCMGGTLALACGVFAEPAAVVSYYGSGVGDFTDQAGEVTCPALFFFGNDDPFIPNEVGDGVEAAFAGHDDVAVHRFDAGHAFDNPLSEDTPRRAAAAVTAWGVTADFLAGVLKG